MCISCPKYSRKEILALIRQIGGDGDPSRPDLAGETVLWGDTINRTAVHQTDTGPGRGAWRKTHWNGARVPERAVSQFMAVFQLRKSTDHCSIVHLQLQEHQTPNTPRRKRRTATTGVLLASPWRYNAGPGCGLGVWAGRPRPQRWWVDTIPRVIIDRISGWPHTHSLVTGARLHTATARETGHASMLIDRACLGPRSFTCACLPAVSAIDRFSKLNKLDTRSIVPRSVT